MPVPHLRLSVSDLGTSTSFYQGALQPLEYRYVRAKGGAIGIGVHTAEFWLTERTSSDKVAQTHILLSVPDREVVHDFYKAALRAGGRPRFAPKGRGEDGYNAAVLDFDDNIVEVTYQVDFNDDEDDAIDYGKLLSWKRGRRELLEVDDDETVVTVRSSRSTKSLRSKSSAKSALRSRASPESTLTADDIEEVQEEPPTIIDASQTGSSESVDLMSAFSNAMGDNNVEVTPNGVLGTAIALMASAAVCYATINAEKDSARQETEFSRVMASREQQMKRRDSKMTNDGQPSPPRIRAARESEDLGRKQLAIEAAPAGHDDPFVKYRNPTFTTIPTMEVEPEYVSLSSSNRHPRGTLARAATMPESVTQIERRRGEIIQHPDESEVSESEAEETLPEKRHRRSSRSSHTSTRSTRPASHISKSHANKALQNIIAESGSESNRSRSRSRSRNPNHRVASSRTSDRRSKVGSMASAIKQRLLNTPVTSSENTGTEESDVDTVLPCDSVSQIGGPAANTNRRRSSATSAQSRPKSSRSSVKSHSYSRSRDYDEEFEQDRTHVSADSGGKRSSPRSPTKRSTVGTSSSSSSSSSRGHRHTRSKDEQSSSSSPAKVIRPSEIEEATDDTEDQSDDAARDDERSSSTVTPKKFGAKHGASSSSSFRDHDGGSGRGSGSYVGSAATMPVRGNDRRSHVASSRRVVASYAG